MPVELPRLHTVFEDKFRLDAVLGEGGFARVYQATDLTVDRAVALKVVKPNPNSPVAARFKREAQLLGRLNHDNVVTLFSHGRTSDGLLYLVFELVDGEDLDAYVANHGPLDEVDARVVLEQLLSALSAAHGAGLLHRDVKPQNIRLFDRADQSLRLKLLDFGIAKPQDSSASVTATGHIVGTPRYMAPEQLLGRSLTPATDLFAVGLVAYEIVVGRPSDHAQLFVEGKSVELPQPGETSPHFATFVHRLLRYEPDERFASAAAALAFLRAEPEPVRRPREAASVRTTRSSASRVQTVVLIALMVCAAGVLGIWLIQPKSPPPSLRDRPALLRRAPPSAAADTPGSSFDASADSDPIERAPGRADGCGKQVDVPVGAHFMDADGAGSQWVTRLPRDYNPENEHPVVMLFHENSSGPRAAISAYGFDELADRENIVLVAPRDSDVFFVWEQPGDERAGRAAFAAVKQSFCIDENRVFAFGFGTGGFGARLAACEPWLRGVAVGSHVPRVPDLVVCESPAPVPMLMFLPTKTGHLPADGGAACSGLQALSFDAFEERWRDRNECGSEPQDFGTFDAGHQCRTWTCPRARLVSCRLNGGTRWPGSPPRPLDIANCDGPSHDFPIRQTVWDFFTSLQVAP